MILTKEQKIARAKELREQEWLLKDIAAKLDVSISTICIWTSPNAAENAKVAWQNYRQSAQGKKTQKQGQRTYRATAKGKETRRIIEQHLRQTPKGKVRTRRGWNKWEQNHKEFMQISRNLRRRLNHAFCGHKNGSAVRDLGCSIEFLKEHLDSQFQAGMTWDNYGDWHIDHIKPLASFDLTDRGQLLEACHYTNLRPLWAVDNIRKGAKC